MRKWINLVEGAFAKNQKLFFVPIRYWEEKEPETGHLVVDKDHPRDDPTAAHVYVYHDGYGHNVYMDRARTFATRDEAIAVAERLAAARH
jgi:hypothetical protein